MADAAWLPRRATAPPSFAAVSPGETVFVTTDDAGLLAAFVAVHVPDSFIHHLFVAPRCQRQGHATSLLASLAPWLPPPWRLKCVRANVAALSFYRRTGWRTVAAGESADGPYLLLESDGRLEADATAAPGRPTPPAPG